MPNAVMPSSLREVPGDPGWPLIGHALELISSDKAPHKRYERYGEISWCKAFGMRWIMMLGPDANQFVLQNRGDMFANSGYEYMLAKFFHRGLMLLDFDEHRLHRRIMQGAFSLDALAGYLRVMNTRIASTVSSWVSGQQFRIFDRFKALTLDIASEAFVGEPPGPQAARVNRAFLDLLRGPTDLLRLPLPGTRWQRGLRARRVLEEFFGGRLPAKRASRDQDLCARLCAGRTEEGAQFTDEDIVNHLIFLMLAAHDTSTITLTNMVYHLAKYPEWQERLREESHALGTDAPELEGLSKLSTMSRVMKEALRLRAPLPGVLRRVVRDCEYKGFHIPAGDLVSTSFSFTQTSHHWWTEPQRFDPDRFGEPRNEDRKHPFMWLPFGGGAHKCIGMFFGEMEVKAILHQILLHFRWSVPENYTMRQDIAAGLPMPRDGLPVSLERL
jgi:cytochrome P450